MAKTPLSPEELKQREIDMHAFLSRIPLAKNAPILFYETLVNELTTLEKTLNKLKAFINFLSKLNPMQYLQWMRNAFAQYVAATQSLSHEKALDMDYAADIEPMADFTSMPPAPSKMGKRKKAKKA